MKHGGSGSDLLVAVVVGGGDARSMAPAINAHNSMVGKLWLPGLLWLGEYLRARVLLSLFASETMGWLPPPLFLFSPCEIYGSHAVNLLPVIRGRYTARRHREKSGISYFSRSARWVGRT